MEIDVKEEQVRVRGEMAVLTDEGNKLSKQIDLLSQQRQDVVNKIFKKQGGLELLQRLDGAEEESAVEKTK